MKSCLISVAFGLAVVTQGLSQVASPGAAATAPSHIELGTGFGGNRASGVVAGLPTGPNLPTLPTNSTPANDAMIRNNAWSAYTQSLHEIPTAPNPNRVAAPQRLVDPDRFVEKPISAHRANFQFSDNEIRSVQSALRRLGLYPGQIDGILGPDTQRAIERYQIDNKRPVTGQPDPWLNASLGIF